jgi:hypothetical protein
MTHSEAEPSVGRLVSDLSEQSSRLVREELELARLELVQTVQHAGRGAGLFTVAGILGWFGVGTLIATAVALLSLALPVWASALIVAVALFVVAGIASYLGKREIDQVSPVPERAMANVKLDVREVKEARSDDRSR